MLPIWEQEDNSAEVPVVEFFDIMKSIIAECKHV